MPLVPAQCTQCGANINVESTIDATICNYCGMAFITEKAIHNYNSTNNISASVVNIFDGNSADFVIRAGVFEKYNGASSVVNIPNNVTIIGQYSFDGCIGLKNVNIPDSVVKIDIGAFRGCIGLTEIIIPSSVDDICESAFASSGLINVKFLGGRLGEREYKNVFSGTPYGLAIMWANIEAEKEKELQNNQKLWRKYGLCCYCGGNLNLRKTKCKSCGLEQPNKLGQQKGE